MKRQPSLEERDLMSRLATIRNLERAGSPQYDGRAATQKARDAAWQGWLDKAGGDPVKAARLRKAALLRGRLKKG